MTQPAHAFMKKSGIRLPMAPADQKKMLLFAIGNSARGDDGLGWAFASSLENKITFPGEILLRYQLQIEDAELCARYPCILFVDAWKSDGENSADLQPCLPVPDASFTTHAVSPQGILQLCLDLYDAKPKAWLLLLKGSSWGLGEKLSRSGQKSLKDGLALFEQHLAQNSFF
jgi:hydrogenase maturation protease